MAPKKAAAAPAEAEPSKAAGDEEEVQRFERTEQEEKCDHIFTDLKKQFKKLEKQTKPERIHNMVCVWGGTSGVHGGCTCWGQPTTEANGVRGARGQGAEVGGTSLEPYRIGVACCVCAATIMHSGSSTRATCMERDVAGAQRHSNAGLPPALSWLPQIRDITTKLKEAKS